MVGNNDYSIDVTAATAQRREGDQPPIQNTTGNTETDGRADHGCRFVSEGRGPVRIVTVIGHLDWTTAGELREVLSEDLMALPVIIDLSQAQLDSAGTGRLVAGSLRSKERSQPMVVVVTDPVQREVFHTIGLADIIPLVHSIDEAQRELNSVDST